MPVLGPGDSFPGQLFPFLPQHLSLCGGCVFCDSMVTRPCLLLTFSNGWLAVSLSSYLTSSLVNWSSLLNTVGVFLSEEESYFESTLKCGRFLTCPEMVAEMSHAGPLLKAWLPACGPTERC